MPLFIIFIFGAVVLGAGAMLAPAWPTKQPRIGMTSALALGLVMGGAVVWAMLFGWNTLVIDYLLFALVTTIFLGGTLAVGMQHAEARGEEYADADAGWPGPLDLFFFVLALVIFAVPALVLPVPLDTDAQGFGYLALMARLGGSFQTLAPFHPEITYLYAPGFTLLTAYLSQQLSQPLHTVQMGIAAVLGLLCVWLAYDLGAEVRDKRLGRAMALAIFGGIGLFTAYMDSHYTTLLGLVFALAFITFALRYLRDHKLPDAIAAGLMLGAVVLAHPDTTVILLLGYAPWLLTMWLGQPRPTPRTWLVLALGVPAIAFVGLAPWLFTIRPLLGSDIVSPFTRDAGYWKVMILYHGVWIVLVAIVGAVVSLRRDTVRHLPAQSDMSKQVAILSIGWLVLVLDFSTLGILERFLPAALMRYDYPFSIAWHGPIIPYTILGGIGLLWTWDRWPRVSQLVQRNAYAVLGVAMGLIVAAVLFNSELLAFSKGKIGFFGAFSSQSDVEAMNWLRENTPPDARILNFPGPQEGDWAPVIAERDSVYYRMQPFFRGAERSMAEQDAMRDFWENPANPDNAELLGNSGIDYVIVPQVVTSPASIETMYRWRAPFTEALEMRSFVADAPYLRLVFDADGAQIYEYIGAEQSADDNMSLRTVER
jgi:hypothetical protein